MRKHLEQLIGPRIYKRYADAQGNNAYELWAKVGDGMKG